MSFAHVLSGFLGVLLEPLTSLVKRFFPPIDPEPFSSLCDLLSYLVYFICGIQLGYCFIFLYKVNQSYQHHALSKPSVHWFVMLSCILSSYMHIICLWTLNYLFYSTLYSSGSFLKAYIVCLYLELILIHLHMVRQVSLAPVFKVHLVIWWHLIFHGCHVIWIIPFRYEVLQIKFRLELQCTYKLIWEELTSLW